MNEADLRAEVFNILHSQLRFWPITQTDAAKCPKCFTLVTPQTGRPDIFVLNPLGRTLVIEMKAIAKNSKSFSFSEIRSNQRHWLDNWHDDGGYGYIGIGELTRGRRLWIVPWGMWLIAETKIKQYQDSIPVEAGKGIRKELQLGSLDMVNLFKNYELKRQKGTWILPDNHQIIEVSNGSRAGTNFPRPNWGKPGMDNGVVNGS